MTRSVGDLEYVGPLGEGGLLCPRPLNVHAWTDGNVVASVKRPTRLERGPWRAAVRLLDDPWAVVEDLGEHPDERAAVGAVLRWARRRRRRARR